MMEQPTCRESLLDSETSALHQAVEEKPPTLEPVSFSKEQVQRMKEDFVHLIDAMTLQPSFFSKMAAYWGSVSFWPKLLLAVVLIVPIIIGFVLNSTVLIPLSICIFLLALGCVLLLENHNQNTQSNNAQLKSGVTRLVDMFGAVIGFIETLKQNFETDLLSFQEENHRLTTYNDQLKDKLAALNHHCQQLEETAHHLKQTKMELEYTTTVLNRALEQQNETLNKRQVQLEESARLYNTSQVQLAELNNQLCQIKTKMDSDLEKGHLITVTLKNAVDTLADALLLDKEQKEAFLKKLERFLADKDASFDKIFERIVQAEKELAQVTKELQETKNRLKQLLQIQEGLVTRETGLIDRLQILTDAASINYTKKIHSAALLPSLGFYAVNTKEGSSAHSGENSAPSNCINQTQRTG